MKLDDLIKKTNSNSKVREIAIDKMTELKEVGKQVSALQESQWKILQEKGMKEAKEFLEGGNFEVVEQNNMIIGKHDSIEIQIKNDSEGEMIIFEITIKPEKIYGSIQIRPSNDDDSKFYQKNSLRLGTKDINFEDYIEKINQCDSIEDITNLTKKTVENIQHFNNTIDNFSKIRYVYSIYNQYEECESFKEVFEKYI